MFERIKSMFSALWGGNRTELSKPPTETLSAHDKEQEAEFEALMQAELDAQLEAERAEEEARKVVEPATRLPEGFEWRHWGDGSGGLYKDGKEYASYDVNPAGYIEYMVLGGRWELSELRVTLMEVQDDIEKRVLDHLNIQQQEVKTLEPKAAEPELRAGQQFFDPDLDKLLKKGFFDQFDHPEEYTPEEWEEICSKEPPNGIITITQEDIDRGEIDVGLEFLTVEEFKKRVKDGYYQPIPQSQDIEKEAYPEPELEGDEELEP